MRERGGEGRKRLLTGARESCERESWRSTRHVTLRAVSHLLHVRSKLPAPWGSGVREWEASWARPGCSRVITYRGPTGDEHGASGRLPRGRDAPSERRIGESAGEEV